MYMHEFKELRDVYINLQGFWLLQPIASKMNDKFLRSQ